MKRLLSIVPACVCFGPLFMTNIGGTASGLVLPGVGMTVAGLLVLFTVMAKQQETIEGLRNVLERETKRKSTET